MMKQELFSPDQRAASYSLNCSGRLLDLSVPVAMGILNIAPDSFYDGGKFTEESIIRAHVEKMLAEGAGIIDVGAASSRPGAVEISEEEELKRLLPALELITKDFPGAVISVDTYRPSIARKAIEAGAHIINDISGGALNDKMYETVAALKVPYVLMHMQGTPQTMQNDPRYKNVTVEIIQSLQKRVDRLRKAGVHDVIVDPGFGFGKDSRHNYELLNELQHFHLMECPILAGFSRKSMINRVLDIKAKDALNGTTVLNTIALLKGVHILRVHDVREAMEAIRLVQYYKQTLSTC